MPPATGRRRGHDDVRRPRRRHARARHDARRRAAAEIDHARRRGGRRGHRGDVVPPRARPRDHRRDGRADRRRPHRDLHGRQRAPRPLLRPAQLLRHARATRCGSTARTIPVKRFVARRAPADSATRRRSSPRRRADATIRRSTSSTASSSTRDDARAVTGALRRRRAVRAATTRYEQIYYRSLRERDERLPRHARLPLALGHRLVLVLEELRRAAPAACAGCYGRERLNSIIYQKVMRWNARWKLGAALERAARRARGVGDPGRRHPARRARRIPRLPACARSASCRSGSARFARADAGHAVSAVSAARPERPTSTSASGTACATAKPRRRGYVNRKIERRVRDAGRPQVALFRLVFHARRSSGRSTTVRPTPRSRPDTIRDNALPDLYAKCVLRH